MTQFPNNLQNTFRTPALPAVRPASPTHATPRHSLTVRVGQIYHGPKGGYWQVDDVNAETAILIPVFKDGSPRPAMRPWVKSVAALSSPFWSLCQSRPTFWERNTNRIVWGVISLWFVFCISAGLVSLLKLLVR